MAYLKECPFCGGKAVFYSENTNTSELFNEYDFFYYIKCSRCAIQTNKYRGMEYVTEKWNKRIPYNGWIPDEPDTKAEQPPLEDKINANLEKINQTLELINCRLESLSKERILGKFSSCYMGRI